MTKVVFEEKYYPAVKEMVYRTRLSNGLTVALLPKKEFKEVYGSVTIQFGSVDTLVTEVDGDVKLSLIHIWLTMFLLGQTKNQ